MSARTHRNWLDQWRLLFAALVLLSHTPELVDGDRHRELLTRVFHTASFGELAVCGFLCISGYLITRAWERAPSLAEYLRNRVLRIAPGFAVAFLLSAFVALAVGGSANWSRLPWDLLTLNQPSAWFPTAHNAEANGALWTIQLEFACYLVAPLLTRSRVVLFGAWTLCGALMVAAHVLAHVPQLAEWWLRGGLMFLSGALYFRLDLVGRGRWLALAAVGLAGLMFSPFWELGLAACGGYLLLSIGLMPRPFNGWPDFSYGLYLYGWPLQKLLILAGVANPWLLFPFSLAAAPSCGAASWYGVESLALRLKALPSDGSRSHPAFQAEPSA